MSVLPVESQTPAGDPGAPMDPETYRVVRYAVVSALGASESVDLRELARGLEDRLASGGRRLAT